jgi:hypothetical protein
MLADVLRDGAERWLIEWSKVMPLVVGVLRWDTSARPWRPVALERWPLEAVRVDLYKRELWAVCEDGREQLITPGDGTWVVAWAEGPFNFAAGLIRCLGEAWIRGINAGRDVANRAQADAIAAIVQEVPEGQDMEKPEIPETEEKLKNLQKGGAAGVMMPPGWKAPTALDLATKNASSSLKLALDTSTDDLLVPWLMQDGTAKNEGGSLAKAQVLDGVMFSAVAAWIGRAWGEETADKSHVPGVITDQIVRPWVLYQADPDAVEPRGDVCPLALRRVPDLEEDARLAEDAKRAASFWAEVGLCESRMRRDMTEEELADLASMRGVRVPATVLRERGEQRAPVAVGAFGGQEQTAA